MTERQVAPTDAAAEATVWIDAYLAALPADQRAALQSLRETIAAAAPEAVEAVSYGLWRSLDGPRLRRLLPGSRCKLTQRRSRPGGSCRSPQRGLVPGGRWGI